MGAESCSGAAAAAKALVRAYTSLSIRPGDPQRCSGPASARNHAVDVRTPAPPPFASRGSRGPVSWIAATRNRGIRLHANSPIAYDPALAKKLLKETGYGDGFSIRSGARRAPSFKARRSQSSRTCGSRHPGRDRGARCLQRSRGRSTPARRASSSPTGGPTTQTLRIQLPLFQFTETKDPGGNYAFLADPVRSIP